MRSMEEALMEMPKHLMYGTMHGYQLRPVQALLSKVLDQLKPSSCIIMATCVAS
jgi:hypothetical protein